MKASIKSNVATLEDETAPLLMQEWIANLISNLDAELNKAHLRKLIKKNAIVHYNNLKMDEVLGAFENNPKDFIIFIEGN